MARKQRITLYQGLKASLEGASLQAGEMGFCTDTKEVFIGDTLGKTYFVGRALSGTQAARPNAGNQGRLYYVTGGSNIGYLYYDSGSDWVRINVQKLSEASGSLDDISDGTAYAKIRLADVTNGQVNKVSDGSNCKTAAEIKNHMDDSTKHRQINDSGMAAIDLWSAQKDTK
ncbi:MAG: hypothetical protein ACERKN_01400 [Velocimicrobium sp.]